MSNTYLFLATFGVVFMLGFQSLSVQSGNYPLAAINSVLIGVFNLTLLRTVPFIQDSVAVAIYIIAGPCGIVAPWRQRRAEGKAA